MTSFRPIPLADYLRRVFTYSPETGKLFWNWRDDVPLATNNRLVGKETGSTHPSGFQVRLNDQLLFVHRIAFVIYYGDCLSTEDEIDHIDLNKFNNRINNLRKATHSQNTANREMQGNNTSGAKSIDQLSSGTFRARIKGIHIGCYSTMEEAIVVYDKAAEVLYGEYRRVSLRAK